MTFRTIAPNVISFRDHMAAASFGMVFRSSAIFYVRQSPSFQTTISFMNYWRAKRSLSVAVVVSLRAMDGALLLREQIPLATYGVVNYRPRVGHTEFEGSVEIEVFCSENMVIPYAAVMAIYETSNSISSVHSYARAYSRFEVEENRTISKGREGCWSIRDNDTVRSFCIFHNGAKAMPPRTATLAVRNVFGETLSQGFDFPALSPYQTGRIYPGDVIPGLTKFLKGEVGAASIDLDMGESFTRMLVGNETSDTDFQVTHSNFDYSDHVTDHLEDQGAFMCAPSCGVSGKKIIVYPDASAGSYVISRQGLSRKFASGDLVLQDGTTSQEMYEFRRSDGPFPSRLVTGMIIPNDGIDNECSLGVLTHLQPKKRFWWGTCAADERRGSKLVVHDMPDIYGGFLPNSTIEISLYSSTGSTPLKRTMDRTDLAHLDGGAGISDMFSDAKNFLNGDFGYFTMFSDYGGLTAYTLFDNHRGSRALEHAF
jgi:hypothetical protein